ncbi:hypothetical protein LZC95_25795 [Pendulispora brunnea]|uniref:Orn/DAP/Arg decarboxylase 2 N-terminal domain-containing protein n=1 Tax=Pendulispora brunnea TaxID=2905690 RepID=A0ABZ2JX77_9BACT
MELAKSGPPSLSRLEIKTLHEALPYLSYQPGGTPDTKKAPGLCIYERPVTEFWNGERPLLLYFPERAVDNYRHLRDAFARYFQVRIHCALKCCYMPAVLRALRGAGAAAEVISELEWGIARSVGFRPSHIVSNGVVRTSPYRMALVSTPGVLIGVDGQEELEKIEWCARRVGRRPDIMIRVNPLPPGEYFSERSKLGVDASEAHRLIEYSLRSPHLELVGVHGHQLVHCADVDEFARFARGIGELAAASRRSNQTGIRLIDLGGGLESRFMLEREGKSVRDFAAAAHDALAGLPGPCQLILEPGRFLFADAAVVLTKVLGTRRRAQVDWLVTDVASNLLRPISDRSFPPVPLRMDPHADWQSCHVVDSLCSPTRFWLDAHLPTSAATDGLALLNCGAYTLAHASAWATDLPDIGYMENGRVQLVFNQHQQAELLHSLYGINLLPYRGTPTV